MSEAPVSFAVYRGGYRVFLLGCHLLKFLSPKIRTGMEGRTGLIERVESATRFWKRTFWVQVASSGELEQAIPILESIKKQNPSAMVLLTYFSPSGKRGLDLEIQRREKVGAAIPWDYADFCPFDTVGEVRRFLEIVRPEAYIAIHREIWPVIISECNKRSIPCYLFATYFDARDRANIRRYGNWLRRFKFIGTSHRATELLLKEELAKLSGRNQLPEIRFVGDPRVERVLNRKERLSVTQNWNSALSSRKTLVLASVWKADLHSLEEMMEMVLKTGEDWRIVVVPHEPNDETIQSLQEWFSSRGADLSRWTQWVSNPDSKSHIVVDTVGVLVDIYRSATVVFVGGSFRGRVHNVLEPAGFGCPILTGPFIRNSGEAMELWENGALVCSTDSRECTRDMRTLMDHPEIVFARSNQMERYMLERSGAGETYAKILNP